MKNNNGTEMTKGQARRLEKKNAAVNAKRAARMERIVGTFVVGVLALAVIGIVAYSIINSAIKAKENRELEAKMIPMVEDFSAGLNEKGFVDGVKASDYVTVDFSKTNVIEIPYSDIEYTDDQIAADIDSLLAENSTDEITYEFNDAFVRDILKENMTADEYRKKLRNDNEKDNVMSWLDDYVVEIIDIKDVPADYLRTMAGIVKYTNEINLNYMNQMYASFGYDQGICADVYEMYNKTKLEYEDYVIELAKAAVARELALEEIFENKGLTISDADYEAFLVKNDIKDVDNYGKPYIYQTIVYEKVMDALYESVDYIFNVD